MLPGKVVVSRKPPSRIGSTGATRRLADSEILSQADDTKLQQLAQELELLPLITKAVWPGPVAAQQSPTTILLCHTDQTFGGFTPESVRHAINPLVVDRLFLRNATREAIVFDPRDKLRGTTVALRTSCAIMSVAVSSR